MAGCDAPDHLPGPQEIKSDLVPHSCAQYGGIGEGRVRLRLTSWACDPCTQKGPAFEVECFAVAAAVFSVRSDETGAYVLGAKCLGSCADLPARTLVCFKAWSPPAPAARPPHPDSVIAAALCLQEGLGGGG